MGNLKGNRVNVLRFVLCTLILCGVALATLVFQIKGVSAIYEALENLDPYKENDMKHAIWVLDFVWYILPAVLFATVQIIIYKFAKRTHPYIKHKEQGYEMLLLTAFVYAVMLPLVIKYSNTHPPKVDVITGTVGKTVIEQTVMWFARQSIFLLIVMMYHFSRADALKDEPFECEEDVEQTEINTAELAE